jgi:exopolyphosphatase/guanosine-5'-triphosphate,3'-diphosphate pyrophosphatase
MFDAVRRALPALCFLFILSFSLPLEAQRTTVRRAAFDIGSAAVKCTVADVDPATGDMVEIVGEFSRKVDFAEDLARSYDGNLSKEIMAKGLSALEEMKQQGLDLKARQFSAVGGKTFRTARNGRAYFVTLKEKLAFPCRITSKQQASLLCYHAVRMSHKASEDGLLVWDIGGDVQRMTSRNEDGSMTFYVDDLASVSFKNTVIQLIQGRDINVVSSPNPVSADQVQAGLRYVRAHAEMNVPRPLADRLRRQAMTVIGIGGVHYYSIPETIGGKPAPFTRAQVAETLKKWTSKPDEAFASEYAGTRLTNLILVLGYMDALDITTVTPLKVNEAHGLLVSPEYW